MAEVTARRWSNAPAKYKVKNAPDAVSPWNRPLEVTISRPFVDLYIQPCVCKQISEWADVIFTASSIYMHFHNHRSYDGIKSWAHVDAHLVKFPSFLFHNGNQNTLCPDDVCTAMSCFISILPWSGVLSNLSLDSVKSDQGKELSGTI